MDASAVIAEIRSLRLPPTDYVVVGGAALAARNLRDTADIDLVVTSRLFAQLIASGWSSKSRPNGAPGLRKGYFEAYLDVNTDDFKRGTDWLIAHAEFVQGIPLVDLHTLLAWKRTYGRQKDLNDVLLLENLLKNVNPVA
jgi:hypothetical protein